MPEWPATLPQEPPGETETAPDLAVRTEMDAGPPKMRRRFTAGVRRFSREMILTAAQVEILDAFYLDTLKSTLSFDWTHPRAGANVTYRFTGPPAYTTYEGNYKVTLPLEILP